MNQRQRTQLNNVRDWYYSLPKRKPDGSVITDGYDGPVVRWNNGVVKQADLIPELNRRLNAGDRVNDNARLQDRELSEELFKLETL